MIESPEDIHTFAADFARKSEKEQFEILAALDAHTRKMAKSS